MDSLAARVEFEPQPYTRYYWKVIVTTDAEEVIESDAQFFETAKMDEPWTGRWITCDSSQERHPIFLKEDSSGKRGSKTRACTFAAWDCMKHIFWGKTKIILRKSVMSI